MPIRIVGMNLSTPLPAKIIQQINTSHEKTCITTQFIINSQERIAMSLRPSQQNLIFSDNSVLRKRYKIFMKTKGEIYHNYLYIFIFQLQY